MPFTIQEMSKSYTEYNNLIFDLGGVIINLAMEDTLRAFSDLSGRSIEQLTSFYMTDLYKQFEKGLISATQFRDEVNELLQSSIGDEDFDSAWNAMLLDIPRERIDVLERLNESHDLYLISNTNEIHVPAFNAILEESSGYNDLTSLFLKAYYSHDVKMRKPDVEIYEFVINENQLDPEKTLMIDDREDNLEGAKLAGLGTVQITDTHTILDYFK